MTTPETDRVITDKATLDDLLRRSEEWAKRLKQRDQELLDLTTKVETLVAQHEENVAYAKRLQLLSDNLAEQLAWFRREHNVMMPLCAAIRLVRNGGMTKERLLEFISSETVDKFLRYREPGIAPHLSNADVMAELEAAQIRLKIPDPGWEEAGDDDGAGDT